MSAIAGTRGQTSWNTVIQGRDHSPSSSSRNHFEEKECENIVRSANAVQYSSCMVLAMQGDGFLSYPTAFSLSLAVIPTRATYRAVSSQGRKRRRQLHIIAGRSAFNDDKNPGKKVEKSR